MQNHELSKIRSLNQLCSDLRPLSYWSISSCLPKALQKIRLLCNYYRSLILQSSVIDITDHRYYSFYMLVDEDVSSIINGNGRNALMEQVTPATLTPATLKVFKSKFTIYSYFDHHIFVLDYQNSLLKKRLPEFCYIRRHSYILQIATLLQHRHC